jgi:N-acyl-D-amino-acid deacylase
MLAYRLHSTFLHTILEGNMARYDLLLKGGTIIDGQRTPRYTGDIAIAGGKIAQIGNVSESDAARVFDARDLIIAPGFIDLHTHFDSQIFWDPYCTMSGWHGITSVVIGNCGFGFAPVKPEDRERAMLTLERNEAIRATTMAAGMPWDWETFPEYLDSIERTPKGVNVLSYMGLAPVMSSVMGLENAKGRPATAAEQKEMCRLLGEAMDAGACGFSAQILGEDSVQRDYDGTPMITDIMAPEDLIAFAHVLREKERGFIQVLGADFKLFEKVAEISGRPVIWNTLEFSNDQHGNTYGSYKGILSWLKKGNAKGLRLFGHAVTCPIDMQFSLDEWNLFDSIPSWRDVTVGSVAERMTKMRDPALRQALRDDFDKLEEKQRENEKLEDAVQGGGLFLGIPNMLIAEAKTAQGRALEGYTVGEIAARENKHPVDAFLDISLSEDLQTFFTSIPKETDTEAMREVINSPFVLPGLSDGGAHMKFLTTGRYPTDFISSLVRDKGLMDLEQAHWRLSGYSAMAAGFTDRGFLREGAPADIIVYDYDALRSLPPERLHDFPADDWRLAQKAEGYRLTIVNGEVTFEDGECTNATPGALLRHGQG